MQQSEIIASTVQGSGCQFVEANWVAAGVLRVTIDHEDGSAVTVDDCERVSRQLQYALEVEGLDYKRLEVSSPGLDRLLRTPQDMQRFAGQAVDVHLRLPFQGRKRYRGLLQVAADGGQPGDVRYSIVWDDALLRQLEQPRRRGRAPAPAGTEQPRQELQFFLAETREIRLVPVLDFRGRRS